MNRSEIIMYAEYAYSPNMTEWDRGVALHVRVEEVYPSIWLRVIQKGWMEGALYEPGQRLYCRSAAALRCLWSQRPLLFGDEEHHERQQSRLREVAHVLNLKNRRLKRDGSPTTSTRLSVEVVESAVYFALQNATPRELSDIFTLIEHYLSGFDEDQT